MHKCHTVQFLFRQHGSSGALKMHDLKMTDKLLANCEHNYRHE